MLQVTPVDCQPMTIVKQIQQIFDAELQSKKIEMVIRKHHSFEDLEIDWVACATHVGQPGIVM